MVLVENLLEGRRGFASLIQRCRSQRQGRREVRHVSRSGASGDLGGGLGY